MTNLPPNHTFKSWKSRPIPATHIMQIHNVSLHFFKQVICVLFGISRKNNTLPLHYRSCQISYFIQNIILPSPSPGKPYFPITSICICVANGNTICIILNMSLPALSLASFSRKAFSVCLNAARTSWRASITKECQLYILYLSC